jgi:hypothetical protein
MFVSFDIGVSLSDTAWAAAGCGSSYLVLDTDCRVHNLLPVLPVLRTGCALAALAAAPAALAAAGAAPGPAEYVCWSELLVRAERRLDKQSTSIRTWFQSHRDRRYDFFDIEGQQGSRRGDLCTTTMA